MNEMRKLMEMVDFDESELSSAKGYIIRHYNKGYYKGHFTWAGSLTAAKIYTNIKIATRDFEELKDSIEDPELWEVQLSETRPLRRFED